MSVSVNPNEPPLNISIGAPSVAIVKATGPTQANVTPSRGVPNFFTATALGGPQGPPGPPGPRGSLFLGGYPTFASLPVPDGVDVKVGDFAFVQDESAIYELK